MAGDLSVDTGGLRSAAASSEAVAAGLSTGDGGASGGGHPSQVGVAAFDAAMVSVRGRHSARITGQSGDLSVSSARYDDTDGGSADAITVTV